MMFYTGDPNVRQFEPAARQARAEVVATFVRLLRRRISALLPRHSAPGARHHPTRVACQD